MYQLANHDWSFGSAKFWIASSLKFPDFLCGIQPFWPILTGCEKVLYGGFEQAKEGLSACGDWSAWHVAKEEEVASAGGMKNAGAEALGWARTPSMSSLRNLTFYLGAVGWAWTSRRLDAQTDGPPHLRSWQDRETSSTQPSPRSNSHTVNSAKTSQRSATMAKWHSASGHHTGQVQRALRTEPAHRQGTKSDGEQWVVRLFSWDFFS